MKKFKLKHYHRTRSNMLFYGLINQINVSTDRAISSVKNDIFNAVDNTISESLYANITELVYIDLRKKI